MNKIKSEEKAKYDIEKPTFLEKENDAIIEKALEILESRLVKTEYNVTCPADGENFLKLKFAGLEHEVFGIVYLNNRNQVIAYEELFRGTIDGASVYPREVVKSVLNHNANAVILTHNHPSGNPEPSDADERITARLKNAFDLIDVNLLDHIIVGDNKTVSFAERGLI